MKQALIALTLTVTGLVAQAGPFVSGGQPTKLKCYDVQKLYQFQAIFLGETVGLQGVRATPTGNRPLKFECKALYQLDVRSNSEVQFECNSLNGEGVVRVSRDKATHQFYGLMIGHTPNGVPDPTPLACERSN